MQILETQFQNLYWFLHMTRHGVPARMNPMSNIRGGKIPDLQVVQAINHVRGLVAVTSPPPHEIKEVLPVGHKNGSSFIQSGMKTLNIMFIKLLILSRWPNS